MSLVLALLALIESHGRVTSRTEREWRRSWFDLPMPFERHGQAAQGSSGYASL